MDSRKNIGVIIATIVAVVLLGLGAGGYWWYKSSKTIETTTTQQSAANTIDLVDGDEDIDWDSLPTKNVTLTNETLTITEPGTYALSGTTSAGVVVKSDGNVRLALNNATIKSSNSAAIYVENAENAVVQLVSGTENYIEDTGNRSDQTIEGEL